MMTDGADMAPTACTRRSARAHALKVAHESAHSNGGVFMLRISGEVTSDSLLVTKSRVVNLADCV